MLRSNYVRSPVCLLEKLLEIKRLPRTSSIRLSTIATTSTGTNATTMAAAPTLTNNTNANTSPTATVTLADTAGTSAKLASRQYSQYQFRQQKTAYYPDRGAEMKRLEDRSKEKSQSMLELRHDQKSLPKDYYYKILGVPKFATVPQIRQAFYALAKRYHPDSTHSEQMLKHFQELSNAYNILTDESKRLEYDQMGAVKDEKAFLEQAGNPMSQTTAAQQQESSMKHHLHNKFRTKMRADPSEKKEEDLLKVTSSDPNLELTFMEATIGCKKRVDFRFLKKCSSCNGKSQLHTNRDVGNELCRRCKGTGEIVKKTATYTTVNVCTQCNGKRYINRSDCETCKNRGYLLSVTQLMVTVPSGSVNGDVVTVDNPNTKASINYHLIVEKSNYFKRDGENINTVKYLNVSDAVLGGTFKVRGLYEEIDVKVDPGTQSHTQMVVKNKGVRTRERIGDHIITFIVRIPSKLNVKQRQLILALAKAEDPVFDCAFSS